MESAVGIRHGFRKELAHEEELTLTPPSN